MIAGVESYLAVRRAAGFTLSATQNIFCAALHALPSN
jgi:hypothetical protein